MPSSAEEEIIHPNSCSAGRPRAWGKVAAKNAKIKQIRVSTASSSYALVRVFSAGVGPGFALMHLSSGAWGVVQFGTELSCKGVSSGVRKDLKLPCV